MWGRHYTLTTEQLNDEPTLIAAVSAVGGTVVTSKSFNFDVTGVAADIQRAAGTYTSAILKYPSLQATCEAAYPEVRVQPLKGS